MKILALGTSTSSQSINRRLASYAVGLLATRVGGAEIDLLDLRDFEMPLYSTDREEMTGIPKAAHAFLVCIQAADALVISFAEHNGSYTAAFKNLLDWSSRATIEVYGEKPAIFLSASSGDMGGASVLATAVASALYLRAALADPEAIAKIKGTVDALAAALVIEAS